MREGVAAGVCWVVSEDPAIPCCPGGQGRGGIRGEPRCWPVLGNRRLSRDKDCVLAAVAAAPLPPLGGNPPLNNSCDELFVVRPAPGIILNEFTQ